MCPRGLPRGFVFILTQQRRRRIIQLSNTNLRKAGAVYEHRADLPGGLQPGGAYQRRSGPDGPGAAPACPDFGKYFWELSELPERQKMCPYRGRSDGVPLRHGTLCPRLYGGLRPGQNQKRRRPRCAGSGGGGPLKEHGQTGPLV